MRSFQRLGFLTLAITAGSVALVAQDSTTGAIVGTVKNAQGQPIPRAKITIDGGRGQLEFQADANGTFRIVALIPGQYQISFSADDYERTSKQTIQVAMNQRVPINVVLAKKAAMTVDVVAAVGALDTTTVTTGTQFASGTFSALPLGRSFTSVASLAPGVVASGVDASNPSIGGGSGLENAYVIDGANTTNGAFGSSGAFSRTYGSMGTGINTDFIQEVQVKSFGMDAEYGQTTGGMVNAITKSGSNTFEGSAFTYFDLDSLQSRNRVPNLLGIDNPTFNNSNRMELGFTAQGPILKDKVFYFVGINPITSSFKRSAPVKNSIDGSPYPLAGRELEQKTTTNSYYAKVQWQAAASHLIELSTFGDPTERAEGPQVANDYRGTEARFSKLKSGSSTVTLKYNGTYFETWFLEARLSKYKNDFQRIISQLGNSEWQVRDTALAGLTISPNAAGLYEKKLENINDQIDVKIYKTFGNFDIKAGFLMEKLTYNAEENRSGPLGFSDPHAPGTVFTTGLRIDKLYYVTSPDALVSSAKPFYRINRGLTSPAARHTETDYAAYFVQAKASLGHFNINAGLRMEEQKLVGTDITYKFKASDNISPRLGVTWDIEGNGKSKLYAFVGRYFEKVPLDIAVRALSTEQGVNRSDFYTMTGFNKLSDPIMDGVAIYTVAGGKVNPTPVTSHFARTGSHPTEILPGTKSMYQDEMVVGYDMETNFGMTWSTRLVYRNIGRVLEDLSLDGDSYYIGNPGENENTIRDITPFTGTATFPKPERKYWALELEAKKTTPKWQGFLNFRLSKLEGNYEGLFRGDNGQIDPNISSLFDLPVEALVDKDRGLTGMEQFLVGALPSDRTLVVNFGLNYVFDYGLNLGFVGRMQTGTPMTTYLAHPVYENAGEVPLYGRGTEGRTPFTHSLDMTAQYTMSLGGKRKLTFRGDVFNLFNQTKPISYDTNIDVGLGSVNDNYMRVNGYNAARQVRLGAKLVF